MFPIEAIHASAEELIRQRYWPNTGDWVEAAGRHIATPHQERIDEGPRSIEELDELAPDDPERDEISKRLSPEDQTALMARYGYEWMPVRKDVA
jgi:hypothetical protein